HILHVRITTSHSESFTDSALVVEAAAQTILNANDCKIMGRPLKQLLQRHPKIDFVLRSHSSANNRLCFEIIDRGGAHIDNPEKYSAEFVDFARAVRARYAIPFASNNCYLHPETEKFNRYLNLGIDVKRYFEAHGITQRDCVVCARVDGWDDDTGFMLIDLDWYADVVSQ